MALPAFQKKVQETHRVIFIRNLAFGKSHGHDYYGSAIRRYWKKFMWWKLVSIIFARYICRSFLLPIPFMRIFLACMCFEQMWKVYVRVVKLSNCTLILFLPIRGTQVVNTLIASKDTLSGVCKFDDKNIVLCTGI